MAAFITKRSQLQWLALLAVAVALPTASLLWFMSRVIANERLVVQQKLAVLYQDKLADASAKTMSRLQGPLSALEEIKPAANPYAALRRLVLEYHFRGLVLAADDDTLIYPQLGGATLPGASADSPFGAASREEFAHQDYSTAADLYDSLLGDADPHIALAAAVGKSRCLSRLGRLDAALAACCQAALAPLRREDPSLCLTVENARLLLLSLLRQAGPNPARANLFQQTIDALVADLFSPSGDKPLLSANQNLFIAQKTLEALHGPFLYHDERAVTALQKLTAAEELSIAAAETLTPAAGATDVIFKTTLEQKTMYGLRRRLRSTTALALLSDEAVADVLAGFRDVFTGTESTYRILDASGEFVAGVAQPRGNPFTVAMLPAAFPGWKVELYFQGGDVFEKAAQRQIAVYIWTGGLVILLVLIAAGLATRAVSRQIRLNSMKNDFIATVSHELKTPLASMRVLVDTVLEGHVRDEAQAKEYLRMSARENERLSRMIDNFLTFSRMERNKKVFNLANVSPASMAEAALDSVRAKFAAQNCRLTVEIAQSLPAIPADHDAIVTVLVNLLDNACKYTTQDKQITLKVFTRDDALCFAVGDNGIGLARRHLRKIFDSFYQVDSSLARQAEGCGLGLSIVKFIVDAHHGRVTVESKPGAGSVFTVCLPLNKHGNHPHH
ncbi:MAG TPA: HAMP domain-containing sensor histidine kinase [Verrucomicrobiae bacterium]|jgi:signal transduction histidine kinase|nr:HAMP domain-containing sensor histidine kinase [Verrucomicrobiae bacterium]